MSRCFPFPPPGYERKKNTRVVPDEAAALIQESIKREQDKAEKERRKEKKREKKEKKKKEKGEKSSLKGGSEKKNHKHKAEGSSDDYQKKKKCETEQLERSGLSEEHGPPTSVPKLCDSSDSTQNSSKRKRSSSPLEGSQNQSTMLRIRLPIVVKHKDPEELQTKEQLCSSSIRAESTSSKRAKIDPSSNTKQPSTVSGRYLVPAQCSSAPGVATATGIGLSPSIKQSSSIPRRFKDTAQCSSEPGVTTAISSHPGFGDAAAADICPNPSLKQSSSISRRVKDTTQCGSEPGVAAVLSSHPSIEPSCSISGRIEVPVQDSAVAAVAPRELNLGEISSLSSKELRRVIQKWVPPVIDMETDAGDIDWLFDVPSRREPIVPKVSHVATCHEGSSLWPKARYMPEVEIYVLPYTVPF